MPNFSTPRSMAGLEDCYSTTRGHSRTTGNFITAVFNAVSASCGSVHKSRWGEISGAENRFFHWSMLRTGTATSRPSSGSLRLAPASSFILWTPKVVESRKFHSLVVLYLGLQQGALPRTHRLPRQGGRIGQGRRRVLGASRYRRPPGGRRSPATKWGVDPRGLSRTGLARKWSNNPKKLQG